MSTIRELITDSYRALGVYDAIETPPAEDIELGLRTLNRLVESLRLAENIYDLDLDTVLQYPDGYERYLMFALAKDLSPNFGKSWTPELEMAYRDSKTYVERLDAKHPESRIPRITWNYYNTRYDVYTDRYTQ